MKDKTNITNSYAEYRNYLEIKNKADSTIADYCAKALKLVNYLIRNNIDTYKLRIDQIESYLAKYKKKSISNNTYAKFVNCTRIFLSFLYDREYLETDISKKIEPVKKIETAQRVWLFDNEIARIEDYIKNRNCKKVENLRDLIIFYFGISCGLRRQEIINLNWSDLKTDEENRPYINILNSKGRKSRIVYISDSLYELLKSYRKASKKYTGAIVRGNYGRRISKSSLQNLIRAIYRQSGVYKKNLNIHSLRHTYAERHRDKKTDYTTVMTLMGHSRLDTTMAYFHVDRQDLKNAVL